MSEDIKVPHVARRFVGFIRTRPAVALLLGLALVGALVPGLGGLKPNFTYRGFFYPTDPLLTSFDAFERQFGNDDSVILVVHSPDGIFDATSAEHVVAITEELWKVPEVIRVDSISNYNWVHADGDELIVEPFIPKDEALSSELLDTRRAVALDHEVIPKYLLSEDAKTAMIFATVKPGLDAPPNAPKIVGGVRELVKTMGRDDHDYYISGGPAITLGFQEASETDLALNGAVLIMVIVTLGVLLRSVIGIVLSLLVVFLSIFAGFGFGGYLGIEITNITVILPQILIAIGVADAVHILVTHLQALSRGAERKEAAEYALLKNFMPTVVTSITTAAGFVTFASAELKPIAGLGIMASFGTLIAWLISYLVLGSLIFIVPIRRKLITEEKKAATDGRTRAFTDILVRHRTAILVGYGALCVLALVLATQNSVNSDPMKYFRKSFPVRVAMDFIESQVGGARGVELAIDAGVDEGVKEPEFLGKVEAFQDWVETLPSVTRTISIIDILKMTNRSLHGDDPSKYILPSQRDAVGQELFLYQMSLPQGMNINDRITIKNDAMRMTVLWTLATSSEVVEQIREIELKGKEMGLSVSATGKNRIWQSMNGYVVQAFITSLSLALFLISGILIVFFRSWRIGLIAMIPNAVPLIIGGGVLFAIGKTLDVGVALVTAVCLGIAVDDTIHVLSNFVRLEREGKSSYDAVAEILSGTGPALMTTSIILVLSFGTLGFGTFVPNIYFGIMTAIILTVALVTDLTFLPAMLLGDRKSSKPPSKA